MEFKSPIKWVVALIGDRKGLRSLDEITLNLPSPAPDTNLLVVYVTEDPPDNRTIERIKMSIRNSFPEGGLMVVKYQGKSDSEERRLKDQFQDAFFRIKQAIALYPSKKIPIIQEKFNL